MQTVIKMFLSMTIYNAVPILRSFLWKVKLARGQVTEAPTQDVMLNFADRLKILELFFCLSFYGDKVYLPTCIHVHFKIRLIHISVTKEMKGLKPYEKWLHIAGGYLKS